MTTQLADFIGSTESEFTVLNRENGNLVSFAKECGFARQAIVNNPRTLEAARGNKQSLYNAILNIAAIGISLNPALSHAYLVPRDGAICLDISYRGLIKLATDSGAIKWVQADLVYESDNFEYKGPTEMPEVVTNPFAKERGDIVGAYCIAKTDDGDHLVTLMTMEEISAVRDTSKSKSSRYSPWNTFPGEMYKKTVIKRAYKTWPQSTGRERLDKAIEVLNEHEGLEAPNRKYTPEQLERYLQAHAELRPMECLYLTRTTPEDVLSDLSSALKQTIEKGKIGEKKRMWGEMHDRSLELKAKIEAGLREAFESNSIIDAASLIEDEAEDVQDWLVSEAGNEVYHWYAENHLR